MSTQLTGASAKILFESPAQLNLKKKLLQEGNFEIISSGPESATNLDKGITIVRTKQLISRDALTDEPIYEYKEFPIKHPRENIADVLKRRLPRDADGLLTVPGITEATIAELNDGLEEFGVYLEPTEFTITQQGDAAYILRAKNNSVIFYGKISFTNTDAVVAPKEVYEPESNGGETELPIDLSKYPDLLAGTALTINSVVYKGTSKPLFSATVNSDLIINVATPNGTVDSVATVYVTYGGQIVAAVPFLAKANTVTQVPFKTGTVATDQSGYVFLVYPGRAPTPPAGQPLVVKPMFTINSTKASVVSATLSGYEDNEVINSDDTIGRPLTLNLVLANNSTKPETVEWEVTGITGSTITYETNQQQDPTNTGMWQLFLSFPANSVPTTRDITVTAIINGTVRVSQVIKVIIPKLTGALLIDGENGELATITASGGDFISGAVMVLLLDAGYTTDGPITLTTTNEYVEITPKVGGPKNQFEIVVTGLPEAYDQTITLVAGVDDKVYEKPIRLMHAFAS